MVEDQCKAYQTIWTTAQRHQSRFYFLDAPGGRGKKVLMRLLHAKIRQMENGIAYTCVSLEIAATLLTGGRTTHSALKLPLDLQRQQGESNW